SWAERAFSLDGEIHDDAEGASYKIVRFLGRGGMGEVYEVVRVDSGEHFALKCLRLEHVRNLKTIERTRREAMTLRDLRHPNVVRVHAIGVREDGLIWMVMDLLTGHTWAQVHRRLVRLPLPWALQLGIAVTAGLEAVHAYAVHRDIKPDNLHLGNDSIVRVLDLGAGKFHRDGLQTTRGGTLGTVPYMSPEQASAGTTIDGRSDIFSLGVVLFEIISSVHPLAPLGLENENMFTFIHKIVAGPPLSLRAFAHWVPGHVANVLDKAVVRDQGLRYGSAAEFGAALTGALRRLDSDVGGGEPLETLVGELNRVDSNTAPAAPFAATAPLAVPSAENDGTLDMAQRDS
ncbi:MAG: serine/threonine-protein kinase, partial [Byssovorax sp.]